MKKIEIDEELYAYIAAHTQHIGESASTILRRLLGLSPTAVQESNLSQGMALAKTAPVSAHAQGTSVFDILDRADIAAQKGAVGRFLFILSLLHRCHAEQFAQVLEIRGRNRLYFATSEQELLAAGNSTNPKQIPGSPYWVVTNNNTTKKKSILNAVATEMGYDGSEAEQIRDFLS
ncbi:MAG: replication initiation negative regulator SeqA [Aliidiomarina sp.]|uniref:replication initiation negative regulator SeqA n=1 Tax=Aliidiomarina sp. TaxID=1872439 RepID=UPI0025B82BCC|nr:replication initiation negative regulator SeqA [Aliidiomarina sp.]MCH8502005.1 replication initiation negative regulator SeqA [Aliidiomarina sp.]